MKRVPIYMDYCLLQFDALNVYFSLMIASGILPLKLITHTYDSELLGIN